MGTELKQTVNRGNLKGKLSEKNLSYFKNDKGEIAGISGRIIVDTAVGKHELRVFSSTLTKDGEPNKMYDNILALKNDYVAAIDATDENPASYVSADFQLRINDFVSKRGNLVNVVNLNLKIINRISETEANADSDDENIIVLTAMYNKMTPVPEKDRDNEGDKNLEVLGVGYTGDIMPFNLFVAEEFVDDVEELYKKGDTIEISVEPRMRHVAGKTKKEAAFGRTANFNKGYDKLRLALVGGEGVIDEEDDLWLDPKLVGEALKEREVHLENLKKGSGKPKPSKSVAKASAAVTDDIPF